MEESVRRAKLRDLDDVLDALERLNLKDTRALPERLNDRLADLGIETAGVTVTELIERVWQLQEQFLGSSTQGSETSSPPSWRGPRRI